MESPIHNLKEERIGFMNNSPSLKKDFSRGGSTLLQATAGSRSLPAGSRSLPAGSRSLPAGCPQLPAGLRQHSAGLRQASAGPRRLCCQARQGEFHAPERVVTVLKHNFCNFHRFLTSL
ncbi:hypothetical protein QL285_013154 [Trifolium repens]|nr:hypothetical protein QL285_013153 [Trifolium repens]KAK2441921.1 hypothetical protein QL285_013154 [Trifolium repens]